MTHTPGPWIVDSSEKDTYVILKGLRYSDYVCKMSSENAQANAALIAATPDMAIALEECIALLEEFAYLSGHKAHWEEEYPELTTARAAISKAKGI
jgi:hypothetical protein